MAIKKYSVKASAEAKAVVASKGEYISAAQFSDTLKSAKKKFNEKFKKGPYACAEVQGMGYIYYNDGSKIYVPNVLRSYDDALAQVKKLNAGGAGKVAASKSFTKTVKASSSLKVKPYVINNGQSGQYYGLKNAEDNQVLHSAPNNWKSEKGAINWAKKKGYEVVDSACGKKSVKAGRYSDVVPYEDRKYWYFTTHGIGPGMLPKGVNVLDTQVGQNRKGTWGDYLLLDAVLNTDELREYDLVELAPLDKEPTIKPYKNKNTISVFDSCGKKSVKASELLSGIDKLPERGKVITKTINGDPTVIVGIGDNKYMYRSYLNKASASGDVQFIRNLIKKGEVPANAVKNLGYKLYTASDDVESACGKKSVKAARNSKTVVKLVLQGNYGYGWDDLVSYDNTPEGHKEMKDDLRTYQQEERGRATFRTIERRVANPDYKVPADRFRVTPYKLGFKYKDGDTVKFTDMEEAIEYAMSQDKDVVLKDVVTGYKTQISQDANFGPGRDNFNERNIRNFRQVVGESGTVESSVSAKKQFGVKASKSAKRRVAATKNVYDVLSDFKHLKQAINDYYYREFGDDSEADFSNSKNVALGYTTYGDNDEWELKLTADLENHKFIYTVVYPDGSYATNEESYNDFADMAEAIEDASFDDLMSLQYFPDLEEDIYLQASCGKNKKGVKASKSSKRRKTIKAETEAEYWKRYKASGKKIGWEAIDEPIVQFDKDLLRRARDRYYKVYVDNISEDGTSYKGSETATKGVRIRLIPTDWEYDDGEVFRSDDELRNYLEADEAADAEMWTDTDVDITASINSERDTKVLAYIADYITDNYPIWVSVDYVVYDGPNDWSVDIFADSQMVANDFVFFLEENNKYLRDRLEEAGILWDVISAHEYHFQFYPYQEQWSAPYIEIDNTVLNSFGDTSEVESALMEEIADYRSTILNYLPEINNSLDNILADYDSGITASTEVSADLQLSRDRLDRKKYNWSDNKNSITDIDGYVKDLADGVVERFPNLTYDISDEAITFTDETGAVVYIQPIDEIVPEKDDLDNDITELGDAIQHANEEADWFSQEQVWDDWDDDPDYATRAVELSRDINCAEETVDIDDLEYITGDSDDLPDMGYGFDSNGDPVDESTVEELERIAQEILDKSEIHNIDEYADLHNFNYYASIPYIQESFDISFTYVADIYELSKNGMATDEGIYTTVAPYNIHFNVRCKNGEVEYAECTDIDVNDGYVKDIELKNFNLDALVQFATDLVNPVAKDIYYGTTNI